MRQAAYAAPRHMPDETTTRSDQGQIAAFGELRLPAGRDRMVPITFGSCFGWLHSPPGAIASARGIVLCQTLGQEARHVHRLWRLLADQLAATGHPVLRFDYPDTGDSWSAAEAGGSMPGLAERQDAGLLDAWIDSIGEAAGFLRGIGVARVTLLGLRFGATLAALAQARRPVVPLNAGAPGRVPQGEDDWIDQLVLLAPVISGRIYMRELRALARFADGPAPQGDAVEASGLMLSAELSRAIAAIDLRQQGRQSGRHGAGHQPRSGGSVLILDPAEATSGSNLAATWRDSGQAVTQATFVDYDAFVENAHKNRFPDHSLARIREWLLASPPLPARTAPVLNLPPPQWQLPGISERPLRFGEANRLFGVLCEPAGTAPSDVALVICNNGSNPHHGHGRFAVTSGRYFAQAGFASFRLDFAGLGDSPGGPREERPHLFDASRDSEISAALSELERLGYRRFVLTGICAGAYHAFHGALADRRVVALYAVNMPTFRWPAGQDPDLAMRDALHATSYYMGEIRRKETWLRLLRGQIDVRTIAGALLYRLGRRWVSAVWLPLAARFGSAHGAGFPRRAVAALSRRGVRLHLLYGHDDPGVEELVRCFGMAGRKLTGLPGCSAEIPADIDHPISHAMVRDALRDRMLRFLREIAAPTTVRDRPT